MTPEIIRRRLGPIGDATRVVVPGRCRGDLEALADDLGVPVQQGPDELKDLPEFFGRKGAARDLTGHDCRIFAEIVEASSLDVDQILARAAALRSQGADVIDLGCLPDTPFGAARGGGAGAEGGGLHGQRRFRQPRRAAARRRWRCRFPLEPDRGDPRARLRDRRGAGPDPGAARRTRRPRRAPASDCCGPADRSSPIPFSTRSTSASPNRWSATTSCAVACPKPSC